MVRVERLLIASCLWLALLSSACWKSSSVVGMREGRTWTEERVVARADMARIQADTRSAASGEWYADLSVSVADRCIEERYVEVQEVETINRKVDHRTVGVPLVVGIVTAIATPIVAYQASTRGDPLTGQPIPPEQLLVGVAVGEGVGASLIGAGIATISVSRNGAGSREKLLSSQRERVGEVGADFACSWRALPQGEILLESTTGQQIRTEVIQGVGAVALPPPSASAPLEWAITLPGVSGGVTLDLKGGEYADLVVTAQLGDALALGRVSAAIERYGDLTQQSPGYDEVSTRLRQAFTKAAEDSLKDGDAEYAVGLLASAYAQGFQRTELWDRAVVVLATNHAKGGDFEAAAQVVGGAELDESGTAEIFWLFEGNFVSALGREAFDDAREMITAVAGFMGHSWTMGAEERLVVQKLQKELPPLLRGAEDPGLGAPAQVIKGLQELTSEMVEARAGAEPWLPEGARDAVEEISDLAASLVRRRGFAERFAALVDGDTTELWLGAARTFVDGFPEHPGAGELEQLIATEEAALLADRQMREFFLEFAGEFGRSAAQNYLASGSDQMTAEPTSRHACRSGREFLKKYGVAAYRRLADEFCGREFPAVWTYAAGTWRERSAEVPVRACSAFFKSPRGCD